MEAYKNMLEEEHKKLTEELESLGNKNTETGVWEADPEDIDPSDADPNTVADRFEDFEERSATMKPLVERLTNIENALGRIEDGSFGTCTQCNGPIEEDRLQANPAATTCKAHM